MLLWACNAFSGARIYERTSRINHSCDFNAIISPKSPVETEVQVVRAVCTIAQGDEINISYLGSWTYADRRVRRERLKRDKYFECQCDRCRRDGAEGDVAASIPCTQCHERVGRFLEEEVQYDDDNEVLYTQPSLFKGPQGQGQGQESNDSYLCPKSLKGLGLINGCGCAMSFDQMISTEEWRRLQDLSSASWSRGVLVDVATKWATEIIGQTGNKQLVHWKKNMVSPSWRWMK